MSDLILVVERLVVADPDDHIDLREEAWSFALDQRAFGPRRLLVALADPAGDLRELVHTDRTDPPELAFALCLEESAVRPAVAVALCDEPVAWGPPSHDLAVRFAAARAAASQHGMHLIDWIACDDQIFRSTRLALEPDADWWDAP